MAIVAAGLLLRIAVVLGSPDFRPNYDSADYDRLAAGLAATGDMPHAIRDVVPGGGPTAFRPPGLTHTLAGVYAVVGVDPPARRWKAGRLVLALLGAAVVALAALVAFQLAGRPAATAAAALTAFDPTLVMAGSSLLTEPLFMTLLLAAAASILRLRATGALRWAVAAGAFAGLASLTRANGVLVLVAVAVAAAAGAGPLRARLRAPALVLACGVLAVAPWTIRNAVELGAFVPVSTETGFTAAGMYNADADANHGRWNVPVGHMAAVRREHPRAEEAEWDEALTRRAADYVLDHPAYPFETAFWNTLRLAALHDAGRDRRELQEGVGIPPAVAAAGVYGAYPMLVLIALGFARGRRRGLPPFLWFVAIAMAASAVLLGGGNARYRAPVELLLAIGAASAWAGRRFRVQQEYG